MIKSTAPAAASLALAASAEPPVPAVVQPPVSGSSLPDSSGSAVFKFPAAGPSVPEPPVLELAASAVPYPSVSMTPAPASSVPAFAVEEITEVVFLWPQQLYFRVTSGPGTFSSSIRSPRSPSPSIQMISLLAIQLQACSTNQYFSAQSSATP